ncbi:ABC transporter ATP-binding protein [Kocuria rosea]|uniref:ABC transporter ATP-binding protein n=1 Tax=Kocuria rosea TaxID=1275 RepID=UPI000F6FB6A0|nr:ABC transporter ATP-binding protein [Kocuria rosea]WJZ67405.1 ATP-binding cassette domain-containing protein [Kocuria rosea]VEI52307.1 Putative HMP/thiamine import ATP-binding protein YkoD [Kocuria rosea]
MTAPTTPDPVVPAGRGARVEARGFGWHHPGRDAAALRGLDLVVEPGERVLLLGPSGAGKSTLLHALAGVLHDDDGQSASGELLLDGMPPEQARGRAGLVQQDPESQVVLSRIGDDTAFGLENLAVPREQIWPRVRAALDDVGLDLPLDHSTAALSGGQKQRLALAGAVAMSPGLLLLDEPTANLDPAGVRRVRDAVVSCLDRSGATLVVVEHRVAVWAEVVDRVVVLGRDGGITHDGAPGRVLGAAADELSGAGVWVPGRVPATRAPARPAAGPGAGSAGGPAGTRAAGSGTDGAPLLSATGLGVSRSQPSARQLRARRRARRRGRPLDDAAAGRDVPTAVAGVELTLRRGRALALTGPNGAGKSTLALTLAGLLAPVRGTVRAHPVLDRGAGPDPLEWSGRELVARVGTVFQEPEHQFLRATVRAELELGPRLAGTPVAERERRTDELLRRLRLSHLADANPFTLSGGEKRRLSVATVLATDPDVLVLDEPTFGQDALTWAELVDLLVELVDAGTSVLAVTHDEDFVRALGAEVLALGTPCERGRAARTAPAAEGAPAVPAARSAAAAGSAPAAPAAPGAGAVRVVPARREPVR